MTLSWIRMLAERVNRWAEGQVAGRFPFARMTLWGLFVAFVLTTFPNYPRLLHDKRLDEGWGSWSAIVEKRDDLFKDMLSSHPYGSHDANMTFRILVPAIARLFGLGKIGVFVFQSLCGVALLWAVGRVAHRVTGDLVTALFVTCGVASTWAGTTCFIELRGIFDGEAILLLALAALFEVPLLTAASVFLCAWTDERGLVASSLVYLYHVNRRHRRGHGEIASFFGPVPMATVAAWVAYFASRIAISHIYGMTTHPGGITVKAALEQINNLPAGCWTALEGGWLLVLAAAVVLVRRRRFLFLTMNLGAIAMVLTGAMLVLDITRSMAYLLPALFVALDVLSEVESVPDLRLLCGASSLVSILSPNYYVEGANLIYWNIPLPVRLLSWAAGGCGGPEPAEAPARGPQEIGPEPSFHTRKLPVMKVLITGSSGLIGSEAVRYFDRRAARVYGIDNNMRADFFGPGGDTAWTLRHLQETCRNFEHRRLDIRDRTAMSRVFEDTRPNLIIHCAAQPSHDLAKSRPFDDFDVNAGGTLNLLEATRKHVPDSVFILMSTNKVYGDVPNELPLVELERRYDYADPKDREGIDETCRVNRCTHSLFGVSKLAGDVMTQEYGRYFGMKTGVFRGGCLTGPFHSAVALHGFLAYMVRVALRGETYNVIGYKGKQVRDQIHSEDVIRAFEAFYQDSRPGEVYNLGGGRGNAASLVELLDRIGQLGGRPIPTTYDPTPRVGDHVCYITNLAKLRAHYPGWDLTRSLDDIVEDVYRVAKAAL